LVLMDIHMPVMDGLEAAEIINRIDNKIPIIAMTANVMDYEKENYFAKGMVDCVGKPFTSEELWRCLIKYIKAKTFLKEDKVKSEIMDKTLQQKLINSFVKNNRHKAEEITNAIRSNDIKLAHRLTHNLKSNSGQLKKTLLQKIAAELERNLKDGKNNVKPQQLEALYTELNSVISEFEVIINENSRDPAQITAMSPTPSINIEETREMLDKLEVLLKHGNAESLSFTGTLQSIPGCQILADQIEELNFEQALITLAEIKSEI